MGDWVPTPDEGDGAKSVLWLWNRKPAGANRAQGMAPGVSRSLLHSYHAYVAQAAGFVHAHSVQIGLNV